MMTRSNNPPVTIEAQQSFNLIEWRKRFIVNLLRVSCILGIIFIIGSSFNDRVFYISLYIGLLVITLIPFPYATRAFASIIIILAPGVNSTLSWGPWGDATLFFIIGILLGALLFDRFVDISIFITMLVFTLFVAYLETQGIYQLRAANAPETSLPAWLASIGDFSVLGILVVVALNQLKGAFLQIIQQIQDALTSLTSSAAEKIKLEEKLTERTETLENRINQTRHTTNIVRALAETQNVVELLETTAVLISEKFGYYHTGLFILDQQKKIAFLQAASSARGKELIGQTFYLENNRKNLLATAVEQNRAIIASDIDLKNFVVDENFPFTRSRMILPLSVRGDVIGLLDLHSDQPRTFKVEDAEILQTLTDLVAISFDNARLINEMQNLVNQLEINTAMQTQRTWKKLISRQTHAYQYTTAGVRPIFTRKERRERKDNSGGLRIPLRLHNQTIGVINLKRKSNQDNWTEREKTLVEKIATQVSLALENSRLVEETQKNAMRDQMIANISTRIRETLDVQAVARAAVHELRRAFDLKEAEILIGSLENESK